MSTALPATSNTGAGGRAQGRSQGAGAAWNSLGANADAETGAYNDWTTDQNIKNSDAAQKLMTNNNFAEGNTRLLSTQLEDASHAGDQWSGWGGIVRSLGSMAMMIPKGGAAPAMPASTGSMTLASGGVPRIGDASEQLPGLAVSPKARCQTGLKFIEDNFMATTSPYWNQQTAGFNQGIGNIGLALARRPMLRSQEELSAAKQMQLAAEAQELGARTGLLKSQTQESAARLAEQAKKGALVEALERSSPAAMKAMAEGRMDDPAIDEYTGAASALTGVNKGDIQKSFKQGMGTFWPVRDGPHRAAAVENPVSVENNRVNADERANRPIVLHDDAQLVAPTGNVLTTGLQKLNPGQRLFDNINIEPGAAKNFQPVAEGNPEPPKSSQVQGVLAQAIARVTAMKDSELTPGRNWLPSTR